MNLAKDWVSIFFSTAHRTSPKQDHLSSPHTLDNRLRTSLTRHSRRAPPTRLWQPGQRHAEMSPPPVLSMASSSTSCSHNNAKPPKASLAANSWAQHIRVSPHC